MIDINTYRQRIGYFNQKLKIRNSGRQKTKYFLTERKLLVLSIVIIMFLALCLSLSHTDNYLLKFYLEVSEYTPSSAKNLENQLIVEDLPVLTSISTALFRWNPSSSEYRPIPALITDSLKLKQYTPLDLLAMNQKRQNLPHEVLLKDQLELIYVRIIQSPNFYAKITYGNKEKSASRGIKSLHLNVRSLKNKICDIKNIIKSHKPHLFGISECELKKSLHFNENQLKILVAEL